MPRSSGRDFSKLTLGTNFKTLDLAERNVPRIAPIQLSLGLQLIQGLLASARGLLNLAVGLYHVYPSNGHFCVDLHNLAPRRLYGSFLL
jgi:hypothetical protein